MARIFAAAIGSDRPYVCTEVFFSVASLDARLDMLDAAICTRFAADKDVLSKWTTARNRIGRRKKRRNGLAHGQVISYFNLNSTEYNGTYLIPYYSTTKVGAKYSVAVLKGEQILDLIKFEKKYTLSQVECFGNIFQTFSMQLNILFVDLFLKPNVSPEQPSESP